jgi:hypothetical protein
MRRVLAVIVVAAVLACFTTTAAFGDDTSSQGYASLQNGGGLVARDGALEVAVPPAAAPPFDIQLFYQFEDETYIPATLTNAMFVSHPFDLRVSPTFGGSQLITTDKPLTITIHYSDSQIAGVDPASLRFVAWVDTVWVPIPSSVNQAAKTVTTQIHGSGTFGLVGGGSPTPAPAPAPAPVPPAAPAPAPAPVSQAPSPSEPMNSTISGRVFYDKNGNGLMDDGDFPVGGAGLLISSGAWSAFTRSAADGSYYFASLRQSSYTVDLVVGPEWAFTTPRSVLGIAVGGQPDTSRSDINFGMWYKVP